MLKGRGHGHGFTNVLWGATVIAVAFFAVGCGGGSGKSLIDDEFTVGGTISGLTASGLVLEENGASSETDSPNSGDTSFHFPTAVGSTTPYNVTVKTQPSGETCTVANGSGSVGSADVTNIAISCGYPVGGAITGLTAAGLVLLNNGGDADSVPANSNSFQFSNFVATGAMYDVTVQTEPAGENCTVSSGGPGTVSGAAPAGITVTCTPTFTVSGTISGLTASGLVLANNGVNPTMVAANAMMFAFAAPLASGSSYAVTVQTQPTGQNCSVTNGSGIITANVGNVMVGCGAPTMIAVQTGNSVAIYTLATFANVSAPTPFASTTLPSPLLAAALDAAGNLDALVGGSQDTFYVCTAASSFQACAAPSTTSISGAVGLMAVDGSSNVYVPVVQGSVGTVIKFAASAGPAANSPSVYQSSAAPPTFVGIAVAPDASELYVVERESQIGTPPAMLFQCNSFCQATPTSPSTPPLNLDGRLSGSPTLAGPVAVNASGTIFLGLANPFGNSTAPPTLAVAAACTPSSGNYTCVQDDVTFPVIDGDLNPFVAAQAIAADNAGDDFVSVNLNAYGSGVSPGPTFYEFSSSGTLAACGGTMPCPLNPSAAAPSLSTTP